MPEKAVPKSMPTIIFLSTESFPNEASSDAILHNPVTKINGMSFLWSQRLKFGGNIDCIESMRSIQLQCKSCGLVDKGEIREASPSLESAV